jgi:prophage antirepressor-like protein
MDILEAFVFNGRIHEVTIVHQDNELMFRASDIAKVLEMGNIRSSMKDFDETEKVVHRMDTPGGPQETIFLTEVGLYRLIMKSRKDAAKPFQKWVCNIIKTTRKTGEYSISDEVHELRKERDSAHEELTDVCTLANKYKDESIKAKSEALLLAYHKKPVTYILLAKTEGENSIIKIGSTKGIQGRMGDYRSAWGDGVRMLNCWENPVPMDFERYLQRHPDIVCHLHWDAELSSSETFVLNAKQLKRTLLIAARNRHKYAVSKEQELQNAMSGVKDEMLGVKRKLDELLGVMGNKEVERVVESEEVIETVHEAESMSNMFETFSDMGSDDEGDLTNDDYDLKGAEESIRPNKRGAACNRGRLVQKYSEDGKTLLKTYSRFVDAARAEEHKDLIITAAGLRKAVAEKASYKGFRWWFAERKADGSTVYNIGDTVQKNNNRECTSVLRLSEDRKSIDAAYESRSAVAKELGFGEASYVTRCVQKQKPIRERMYVATDEADPVMVQEFIDKGGVIPLYVPNVVDIVNRLHPDILEVLETFQGMRKVELSYMIKKKALLQAIAGNFIIRGSRWSISS